MIPAAASVIPLAEPLPLPAPVWLLWGLLLLTLVLHLIAMNLLVGGSLLAGYARIRFGANVHAREMLAHLARPLPVLMAATVSLGVAPLLFLQVLYGRLFFVSSILMAWAWLAVVPALIVAYYTAYAIARRADRGRLVAPWLYTTMAVALLGIGFLYTTNMTLMLGADRFAAMYGASGRGLHLNFAEPTLWPRWLHMMFGAVAVAGLAIAVTGFSPAAARTDAGRWAQRFGAQASAWATGINLIVGIWWLARLPAPTVQRLMGNHIAATSLFAVSVIAGLGTLLILVMLTRPGASFRLALSGVAGMLATIVTMLLVRDQVRAAALDRFGFAHTTWVAPQWGPFGLFALLLVGALGIVGWMAAVFLRSAPAKETVAPAA